MTVDRIHTLSRETRYTLNGTGLACVLTYTAAPDEPASEKTVAPTATTRAAAYLNLRLNVIRLACQ